MLVIIKESSVEYGTVHCCSFLTYLLQYNQADCGFVRVGNFQWRSMGLARSCRPLPTRP